MLIDLHVHSTHTEDSPNTFADIASKIAESGLDGFCLTDINTMAGYDEAKKVASEASLVALVGMEAVTDKGHFLVFYPEPEKVLGNSDWLKTDDNGRIPVDLLSRSVKELGGILIAAHPYDKTVENAPGDAIIQLDRLAAIEVGNARRSFAINQMAEELAAGTGLVGVAGSDARLDLSHIGSVATLFRGRISTESDLIEKVLSFEAWPVLIGKQAQRRSAPRRRQTSGRGRSGRSHKPSDRNRGGRKSRDGRSTKSRGKGGRGSNRS